MENILGNSVKVWDFAEYNVETETFAAVHIYDYNDIWDSIWIAPEVTIIDNIREVIKGSIEFRAKWRKGVIF